MDFEADIVAHELVLVMDKFTAADVLREVSVYDAINKAARYTSKVRPAPRPHRQAWAVKVNTLRGSSVYVRRTMMSRGASYCAGRRRRPAPVCLRTSQQLAYSGYAAARRFQCCADCMCPYLSSCAWTLADVCELAVIRLLGDGHSNAGTRCLSSITTCCIDPIGV